MLLIVGEKLLRLMPDGTHEWSNYINVEDVESVVNNV
jgi:2-polyprenyl-3-methyl-5-hydroxy-6-metoxy-1,4-benzoquinol methylase